MNCTGRIFTLLTRSMALHFTATKALLATRHIWILPKNQHAWPPITFGIKKITIHRSQGVLKMLSLYTLDYVSLFNCFVKKTQIQESPLHLRHTRHQLSLDEAGLHGSVVESVNSIVIFCVLMYPASETKLHQKRISTADQSHLRWQTVETKCKIEPC
jgi:hypothetical protein